MSNYIVADSDLTSVANAIRTKGGTSAQLAFPSGFVSAIGDISGGGGATTYTGTVELTNTDTDKLTIPVDVSGADVFTVVAWVDRTGNISGGVVTYDDEPTVPAVFDTTQKTFVWYYSATVQNSQKQIKRDSSNYSSVKRPNNASYCYLYAGNSGAIISIDWDVISETQIKLVSANAGRRFCATGAYARFAYIVIAA